MSTIIPNFREAASGPGVVCLHANASSDVPVLYMIGERSLASGAWRCS
jgi:hypothetical protein